MGQQRAADSRSEQKQKRGVRSFLKMFGAGLVTGAADDDPSGVATYAQAGATYGMGLLWTVPVSLPMMMTVQETCDRMTLASADSLGALIRRRFRRGPRIVIGILIVALIAANTLNIAADLMAIGQGMQLLHAGPAALWSLIAGVGIGIAVVAGSFDGIQKIFKWLCLVLLAYVGVLFAAHVDWGEVLAGLVGARMTWSPAAVALVVAVLGTSISPYMFFWQSAERIEELRAEAPGDDDAALALKVEAPRSARRRLRAGRVDVFTGMAVSALVMFAIMVATAATLGEKGESVTSAADAAQALGPVAGPYAQILFAVGFIGAGVLAVPVLAAAGASGLSALLGKKWGLEDSPRQAPAFYALLGVGLVGGTVLALVVKDPIGMLVLSALVNGVAAGPFLIVIMLIADSERIMGRFRNGRLARIAGWTTTAIMCAAGGYGVWSVLAPS